MAWLFNFIDKKYEKSMMIRSLVNECMKWNLLLQRINSHCYILYEVTVYYIGKMQNEYHDICEPKTNNDR